MRTMRLRVGPGPTDSRTIGGLLLAVLLVSGCSQQLETTGPSDGDDGTDLASAEEAGTIAEVDGSDTSSSPPDTGTDTSDIAMLDTGRIIIADDAGDTRSDADDSPPVEVTLRLGDRPVPGATVVFHDPDGGVLDYETTDADGRAARTIPDDAMITYGVGADPVFRTITGVQPGESLDIRLSDDASPSIVGTAWVHLPSVHPEADSYEISLGCNTELAMPGETIVEIDILDSCTDGGGEFDLVIRALARDVPVAYAVERDIERADSGGTAVELDTWHDDWVRKPVEVTNAPDQLVAPTRGRLGMSADDQHWQLGETGIALDNGAGQTDFQLPPDFADSVSYRAGIWEKKSGGAPHVMSIVRDDIDDTTSAPITVDLQKDLLPALELVGILQQVPERPTISWEAFDDLSDADVGVAVFTWTDEAGHKQQWHAYVRPTREGSVRFPELPDLYDSLEPVTPSSFEVGVAFVDRADVEGYATFRNEGPVVSLDHLADGTRARLTRLGFF